MLLCLSNDTGTLGGPWFAQVPIAGRKQVAGLWLSVLMPLCERDLRRKGKAKALTVWVVVVMVAATTCTRMSVAHLRMREPGIDSRGRWWFICAVLYCTVCTVIIVQYVGSGVLATVSSTSTCFATSDGEGSACLVQQQTIERQGYSKSTALYSRREGFERRQKSGKRKKDNSSDYCSGYCTSMAETSGWVLHCTVVYCTVIISKSTSLVVEKSAQGLAGGLTPLQAS